MTAAALVLSAVALWTGVAGLLYAQAAKHAAEERRCRRLDLPQSAGREQAKARRLTRIADRMLLNIPREKNGPHA